MGITAGRAVTVGCEVGAEVGCMEGGKGRMIGVREVGVDVGFC